MSRRAEIAPQPVRIFCTSQVCQAAGRCPHGAWVLTTEAGEKCPPGTNLDWVAYRGRYARDLAARPDAERFALRLESAAIARAKRAA